MKKQIVSETKNYEPSTVDELLLDDTPKVNSFNFVTSDGIARAIAGASGEVPVVTENDNGKILTAIYDEGGPAVEWADAPHELPSTLGTAGQVLKVNAGETGVEWGTAGANYSAGDGIRIDQQNEISVNAGTGLAINNGSSTVSITLQTLDTTGGAWGLNSLGVLTADAVAALRAGAVTVTPVGAFTAVASEGRTPYIAVLAINNYGYPRPSAGVIIPLGQPSMPVVDDSFTLAATPFSIDFTQLDTEKTTLSFDTVAANPSSFCIAMISADSSFSITDPGSTTGSSYGTYQDCSTLSYSSVGDGSVYVVDPVPTYAAGDAGKVLTVNAGATGTEWTNYTQIEVVSSLPASPTSGVLYIVTGA